MHEDVQIARFRSHQIWPGVVDELYYFPACLQCAVRLPPENVADHLDLHFKENKAKSTSLTSGPKQRGYYPTAAVWCSQEPEVLSPPDSVIDEVPAERTHFIEKIDDDAKCRLCYAEMNVAYNHELDIWYYVEEDVIREASGSLVHRQCL
jgi:hypothetical protein